jgi:hypothetical protein
MATGRLANIPRATRSGPNLEMGFSSIQDPHSCPSRLVFGYLERHHPTGRNAGDKLAKDVDKAARYDFVMEGTTSDRQWKGWLGGDSSERGYDPGGENTFTVHRETVRPIVRKPSKRFACILSYGPIEDRVNEFVVFEPVEKLKVE